MLYLKDITLHCSWTPTGEQRAPFVLVLMNDGSLKFCIHFTDLNAVAKFESNPMPCIDKLSHGECGGQAPFITSLHGPELRALAGGHGTWERGIGSDQKTDDTLHFKVMSDGLQRLDAELQGLRKLNCWEKIHSLKLHTWMMLSSSVRPRRNVHTVLQLTFSFSLTTVDQQQVQPPGPGS